MLTVDCHLFVSTILDFHCNLEILVGKTREQQIHETNAGSRGKKCEPDRLYSES